MNSGRFLSTAHVIPYDGEVDVAHVLGVHQASWVITACGGSRSGEFLHDLLKSSVIVVNFLGVIVHSKYRLEAIWLHSADIICVFDIPMLLQ